MTKYRDGEPGGIQCIDTLYEFLGIPLPPKLSFPVNINQRVKHEETRNQNDWLKRKVEWLRKTLREEKQSNEDMEVKLFEKEKDF